jgi:hypothetical protein
VLSLPVAVALIAGWLMERRATVRDRILRGVLPIAIVLILAGMAMGYYFWRVTGSPVRMPYQVERETYATAPIFLWQSPRAEPVYRHAVMREFYTRYEQDFYYRHRRVWLIEPDRQPVQLQPSLGSDGHERPGHSRTPVPSP